MGADQWLGLVKGALDGVVDNDRTAEKNQLALERIQAQQENARLRGEIQMMIASMNEGGRNSRATLTEGGRNSRFTEGQTGATTRTEMTVTGANSRAAAADATTRRGQDMTDDRYWGGENPLAWDRNFLTRRGQDVGASTSRRGQDLGAETTRRGQDMTAETAQRGQDGTGQSRALGYALSAYRAELQRRGLEQRGAAGNLFPQDATAADDIPEFSDWVNASDDPEIFPSVKEMFKRGTAPPAAAPSAPAAPAATTPKGPVPVAPRPQATAPGAGLEQQAAALIAKIRQVEAGGKPATAERAQLAALRAQVR